DYLINIALVALVLRQLHERRLDFQSLALPVILVGVAAQHYLHAIPTEGNDLVLIVALSATGAALGMLCAAFTNIRPGADGVALARAGWAAATLWVVGIGSRMAFSYFSDHGARATIAHFSAVHHITGSA